MTDRPLDELIAKLEAAREGNRELDAAIWWEVGPEAAKNAWRMGAKLEPSPLSKFATSGEGYEGVLKDAPYYTFSLDAALALVPEGWEWQVSNRAPNEQFGRAYIHNRELQLAGMGGMRRNPKYLGFEYTAATPALALCIAALKARTATLDGGEG